MTPALIKLSALLSVDGSSSRTGNLCNVHREWSFEDLYLMFLISDTFPPPEAGPVAGMLRLLSLMR